MRKTLYLLKDPTRARMDVLPSDPSPDQEASVILIQDGVRVDNIAAHRVYALGDDVTVRNVTSSYPMISYADMLRMMFEADVVIAL